MSDFLIEVIRNAKIQNEAGTKNFAATVLKWDSSNIITYFYLIARSSWAKIYIFCIITVKYLLIVEFFGKNIYLLKTFN